MLRFYQTIICTNRQKLLANPWLRKTKQSEQISRKEIAVINNYRIN
jgi:hypothetical protein